MKKLPRSRLSVSAKPRARRSLFCLLSLILVLPAIHAQDYGEKINVTAVELIAEVVDESGRVPDDLKPEDLIVLEDGVERPIIGIERITLAEAPPQPTSGESVAPKEPESPRAQWQVVIYFDQTLSGFLTLEKAAESLRKNAAQLARLGPVEIVLDAGHGPKQQLAPTTDAASIARALDEIGKLRGLDQLTQLRREALTHARSWDDDRSAQATRFLLNARASISQEAALIARFRNDMAAWLDSFQPHVPRALILVSDGFDLDPRGFYVSDRLESPEISRVQSFMREHDQSQASDALARALSIGAWTTTAIRYGTGATFTDEVSMSGEGKMVEFLWGENNTSTPKLVFVDPEGPLKNFAEATGGSVVRDLGKVDEAIAGLQQRVRVTYQVAREADEKIRKIEVRSRRRGLKISTFRWVSASTPETVAGARAVKLLEGRDELPELPLFARFKRAEARTGKQPPSSGTIEARLDLRPIGALRAKLSAATLRITVAVERKAAPPIVRHEIVRGYDASMQPRVDYTAPMEMSNDATKIAIAIEELASGAWGGATIDLATGLSTTLPAPLHLAVHDAFERAQRESKIVVAEFRQQCEYCPPVTDVTAHPAVERLLDGILFVRRELDPIDVELYRVREFPLYAVFDPWKREFVRWRGHSNVGEFAATLQRILAGASYLTQAGALNNRGEEARAAVVLGVAYREARWLDEAKTHLRRVKDLTADPAVIQNAEIHLALTYLRQGDFGEAIRLAQAVADAPLNAEHQAAAWLTIGQAKKLKSDEKGAVEAFSRAEKAAPPESTLRKFALDALAYFSSSVTPLTATDAAISVIRPTARILAGRVKFQTMIRRADVARVDFSLDGKSAIAVYRPPFSAKLDLGRVPQEHRIEVLAYADDGRELGRDALTINDRHDQFSVRITEPASPHARGETTIRAEVQIPQSRRLEKLELLVNETKIAALTKPPFVHTAKLASDGTPSVLSAVATLDDGSRAEDVVFLNSNGLTESVNVHLVELYTAVVDQKDAPVSRLTREDFTVLENGKPQPIERFKETTSDPMTIGLAIDSSESMKEEIIDLQETASLFLQMALAYEGRAFLIDFDSELRLRQPTTSDLKALQKSAQHLTADGGTALYDAIVFGLLQFQGVSGKKALVVLTDGQDQISRYDHDAVIGVAKESGVSVFIIVLDTESRAYISSADLSGANRPLVLLQRIADQTGGKAYHLRSPEGLVKVYEEIDKELRSQYLLTYRPSSGESGKWRDVDVRVKKKGMRARAVAGYYAE